MSKKSLAERGLKRAFLNLEKHPIIVRGRGYASWKSKPGRFVELTKWEVMPTGSDENACVVKDNEDCLISVQIGLGANITETYFFEVDLLDLLIRSLERLYGIDVPMIIENCHDAYEDNIAALKAKLFLSYEDEIAIAIHSQYLAKIKAQQAMMEKIRYGEMEQGHV